MKEELYKNYTLSRQLDSLYVIGCIWEDSAPIIRVIQIATIVKITPNIRLKHEFWLGKCDDFSISLNQYARNYSVRWKTFNIADDVKEQKWCYQRCILSPNAAILTEKFTNDFIGAAME